MPEPEAGGDDLDEAEIARGGLVSPGGDATGVFQTVDAALDAVAQGMDGAAGRLGVSALRLAGMTGVPPRAATSSRMASASQPLSAIGISSQHYTQ